MADDFRKRRISFIFIIKLLKLKHKKTVIKVVKDKEESKESEGRATIFRLNNIINSLEQKVRELEGRLAKADVNKVELQKRIQNAFLQGLATIDEETVESNVREKPYTNVVESLRNVKSYDELSFGNRGGGSDKLGMQYESREIVKPVESKDYMNYTYAKPRLESKEHLWQKAPVVTHNKIKEVDNMVKKSEYVDKGKIIKYQL